MVGNVLVCVVVFKNHRMQTAMNMFLVNLAICDMFVCVINIWFTMIYWELEGAWPFGLAWCKIMPSKYFHLYIAIELLLPTLLNKVCYKKHVLKDSLSAGIPVAKRRAETGTNVILFPSILA